MKGFTIIFRREAFGLFISPATYVVAFYFLILLGVGFRFFIESFVHTGWILPPLASLVVAMVFGSPALVPFLTMRSLAEERRLGTLETLFAAPVSTTAVVMGKWSASYMFFLIICVAAFGFPWIATLLHQEGTANLHLLNEAQLIGGAVYLAATGMAFTAIGLFASAVTRNQMVAGMLCFTLLALHVGIMAFSHGKTTPPSSTIEAEIIIRQSMGSLLAGFDKMEHFVVGLIDVQTLIYFIITTGLFLGLAILATERASD